jgi:hypothetical protein
MAEQLTPDIIDQTPDVTLEDVLDQEALLNDLARLSPLAYDQCRQEKAELLKIRVTTLDTEVAKRQPRKAQAQGQGTPVAFEDPQPWPSQVQGADLLDELAKVYAQYLILPPGGADVLALWTVHTYIYDAWNITPHLGITSPLPRCGKTRVLEALSLLTPRVLLSSSIHLSRDSWVSVRYPEGLNAAKSSDTYQRTDRHGILGEKPSSFQGSM